MKKLFLFSDRRYGVANADLQNYELIEEIARCLIDEEEIAVLVSTDNYEVLFDYARRFETFEEVDPLVAQRITLEATLLKLEEEADELLNCGNSHEQARGSGIKTAIERIRVV